MKWTTDKPTREGHYFVRFPDATPTVVYLNVGDELDEIYWNDGDSPNDDPSGTQYAGPIEEPSSAFNVYDTIKEAAARHGLSPAAIHVCFQLGFDTYCNILRLGGFFPHHK